MTKIVLCGALFGLISLSAQDTETAAKKLAEAKRLCESKFSGASIINGPTVKGAPYSAQAVNEMVQVLADGNRITNTNSSMLYRDSQGRERREETSGIGTVRSMFITDPVEGVSYTLDAQQQNSAQECPASAWPSTTALAAGSLQLDVVAWGLSRRRRGHSS